ncbi:MAG: HlyD family secretion protein, partial [Sphingomonas sp.]|nr:HlyD family secretion protein [Sphingomonas sp.]
MADADPKIETKGEKVAAANVIETVEAPPTVAKKRSWLRIALMISVPLLIAAVAGYFYLTGGRYQTTDNAYISQDMISISPDVSGRIVQVNVRENQRVKAGDILLVIDPEPYRIALEQANAAIATARVDVSTKATDTGSAAADIESANADISLAQATYDRQNALWKKGF